MTTVMPTTISRNAHGAQPKDTNKTALVYGLIRDANYEGAIAALNAELSQRAEPSRAGLSLLGYCQFRLQRFEEAAESYGALVRCCASVAEYRFLHAQSLYQAGRFPEASRAAAAIDDPQYEARKLHLQASIKYEEDDMAATKAFVSRCLPDDPDTLVARGCVAYKEGDFDGAAALFAEAMGQLGYQPDVAYNAAVCAYKTGQYGQALKHVAEIIDRGVRDHPELSVGAVTDGLDVRSVGNSQALKETAMVEAFNLRAAIEFRLGNGEAAREALSDMPPRADEELDPVTLHNMALTGMDEDPNGGFKKLKFLLASPPFPPETFGNLLILLGKYKHYSLAADVLADNVHLHQPCLGQELYDYLEAMIDTQSAPGDSYRKFDALAKRHVDTLRKLTKGIQDARVARDNNAIRAALKEYDDALDRFMPVLMAQAGIYWDKGRYGQVERIFRQTSEFASEHDVWKLNVAHVFFVQGKFREAIQYYEPIVRQSERLLDIPAVVLANLCVAYIMTSQNAEAESLMRTIEHDETAAEQAGARPSYTLTVINASLGVLYASKGNFPFGLSRIFKSVEPFETKLSADTWYYAKISLLALCEQLAKYTLTVTDEFLNETMAFLDAAERHGRGVLTVLEGTGEGEINRAKHNVAAEARLIKRMLLKLRE